MNPSKFYPLGILSYICLGLTIASPAVANRLILDDLVRTTQAQAEVNTANQNNTENFIQEQLFFGLSIPGGGIVTEEEWENFLNEVVTPRFPNGLTVISGSGQYLESTGILVKENTKIIYILYENTPNNQANDRAIHEIIDQYKIQFRQESVLRATTPIKANFE